MKVQGSNVGGWPRFRKKYDKFPRHREDLALYIKLHNAKASTVQTTLDLDFFTKTKTF